MTRPAAPAGFFFPGAGQKKARAFGGSARAIVTPTMGIHNAATIRTSARRGKHLVARQTREKHLGARIVIHAHLVYLFFVAAHVAATE